MTHPPRPPRPRPPVNPAGGVYVVPPDRPGLHRRVAGRIRAWCAVAMVGAAGMVGTTCLWPAPWWAWGCAVANLAAALVLTAVVWVSTAR